MDDRGDKIVNLAREMLRSDMAIQQEAPGSRISMSFKLLCITTLIAALGSSVITWCVTENHRGINRYERVELEALVFYASHFKGLNEKQLKEDISGKFNVASFDDITEGDFQSIRRYLQDKAQ